MGPLPVDEGDLIDDLRRPRSLITSAAAFDDWPGVAARIVTRLRRMGAERMNAEDLASEAVMRAWTKQVAFESPEHFFNWTMLVARNLYYDQRRADSRAPDVCAIEDIEVPTHDTATIAEHRMQLRRVLDALGGMSADDRMAVMSDATPADRKDAVRLNVRRHRARARLKAVLAGITGLLGLRRLPKAGVATTPVAFATVLVTIGLPFAGPALRDGEAGAAVPRRPAVVEVGERPATHAVRRPPAPSRPAPRAAVPASRQAARPAQQAPAPSRPGRQEMPKVGGDKTYVQPYIEPNGPDEHLVCLTTGRLGELCAGRPIEL